MAFPVAVPVPPGTTTRGGTQPAHGPVLGILQSATYGKCIPHGWGQATVSPFVAFMRNTSKIATSYVGGEQAFVGVADDKATTSMSAQVADCVLIIADAPGTIVGVIKGSASTGTKNSDGTTTWDRASALKGLRRLSTVSSVGHLQYLPNPTMGYEWVADSCTPTPFQIIEGSSSPWGLASSATKDVYTSITGTTLPAWAYLSTDTQGAAGMAFPGVVSLRYQRLVLSDAGKVPSLKFVVQFGGSANAHPIDVIRDILVNILGVPTGNVVTDVGPDGLAASSARRYIDNMAAWRINRAITERTEALGLVQSLCDACNLEMIYSEGKIKVWPLGDSVFGSYAPATVTYALGVDELGGAALVQVDITPDSDVYNCWPVQYRNLQKDGETGLQVYQSDFEAARDGERRASTYSNDWISSAQHAHDLAQIFVRKSMNARNRYRFSLGHKWAALEPGDIVSISDGNAIVSQQVRIALIEEQDDGSFAVEATQWVPGVGHPITIVPQPYNGARVLPAVSTTATAQAVAAAAATSQDSVVDSFDHFDPNDWEVFAAGGSLSVEPGGLGGGKVLRNTGGQEWIVKKTLIPYDPSRLYQVRVRWRRIAGLSQPMYAGFVGVAEDGVTLVNSLGSNTVSQQHYISQAPGSSLSEVVGYWKGSAATGTGGGTLSAPGQLHSNARYVRLLIYFDSYSSAATMEIDTLQIVVTDPAAEAANTAAAAAASAAAAAQADATSALGQLTTIASDNVLSAVEKSAVIRDYSVIIGEQSGIDAQATAFSVSRTAYDAAVAALTAYLGTLTAPTAWNAVPGDTTIVGTTFRQKFADVYAARQALLNAISAAAKALADGAQSTASGKSTCTISASPPGSPATGDVWYSSDTTTNCPDANCKGHTVDAFGAIRVGSYPHRLTSWPHRWSGSAWLDVSGGTGYLMGTPLYNLLSGIDGSATDGYVRLCQNEQPTTRGGAPDITRLSIITRCTNWYSPTWTAQWAFSITPSNSVLPGTDNIDTLKCLRVKLYASSTDASPIDVLDVSISGRAYKAGGSAADNAVYGNIDLMLRTNTNYCNGSSPYLFTGYLRCSLQNLYGWSAELDFSPTNVVGATLYKNTGTITGSSPSGGGGGSGSGGGGDKLCPAEWVRVNMADGTQKEAGRLQVGDLVWTQPEDGGGYGAFPVEAVERSIAEVVAVNAVRVDCPVDLASLHFTPSHPFDVDGKGWVEAKDLQPGDVIQGSVPRRVLSTEALCTFPIVKITIGGAHTFETCGLRGHNKNYF